MSTSSDLPKNFRSLDDIQEYLRTFAHERDWEKFHAPKNLAMALAVEASELMEIFQWLPEEGSRHLTIEQMSEVEAEMADVFLYLLRMADVLKIDLMAASERKTVLNEQRYPVEKAKGHATKYTNLD
ncbi:nucleotide pyrophosphohydrolase [Teredinibacter purpureus]|uniref:nucleotide pyrophosphohydrolase n=1 Tax=Teredinibacter purpureus TaxID=2731756 RepID=UPI0005F7FB28|nr:nucleotide pyrophosphohydrolase [Teredinibacter purpureus]